MLESSLPRLFRLRQNFLPSPPINLAETVRTGMEKLCARLKRGNTIAVAVGSRGISNLQTIVAEVLECLKQAGARPFIVPAMGSHGGGTPAGQTELLAEYGIRESTLGVPIKAAMETEKLGLTPDGVEVVCCIEALRADGILLINRIKPHTDFAGSLGSGILKMMAIGLGKKDGAAMYHAAASRLGYERVIRSVARCVLSQTRVLGALGIVENQAHETALISVLDSESIESQEARLLIEARRLMPQLPFEEIDLLIVDWIGKNISGAGMDPNVIGRGVHGYSSELTHKSASPPVIHRIFARNLTPESHGNAIGIGMADFTSSRLVRAMNPEVTYLNGLTALTPQGAKIPIHFESDRVTLGHALTSLALQDPRQALVVRIADTLSLAEIDVSEAYLKKIPSRPSLTILSEPREPQFDAQDHLL